MKNLSSPPVAEARILRDVAQDGFHIALQPEGEEACRFAYTIGLYHSYQHPEIICFDLNPNLLGTLLNNAEELINAGEVLQTNHPYAGFLEDFPVQFVAVRKEYYCRYLGNAQWFYKDRDFPVLQLVWPDQQQHFPWEADYHTYRKFIQPLLDR